MNILLANKFFYPKGGAETVFFQEREFLKEQGHKIIDFAMEHPDNISSTYANFFVPCVNYHDKIYGSFYKKFFKKLNIAINFIHNKTAVVNINRLIQNEKPDIAHLHNIYHQISPAIINVLKRNEIKIVLTLHDYKVICPIYKLQNHSGLCNKCAGKHFWHVMKQRCQGSSLSENILLSLESYWHKWFKSYENVDLFLAPSQFMADLVSSCRIDHSKIKILPNGIDTIDSRTKYEDLGYGAYIGRLSNEKGLRTLINAQMKAKDKALPLKIIGTGPLLANLKKDFPFVDFLGFKNGEELQELIRRSSFIVVPSEWYENCSMSVLEAMAHGKPVIGSRIGGISEQIEDQKTGLLFEPGNEKELTACLIELSQNLDLRIKMGKNAQLKLEKEYSLKNHCNQLLSIYEHLIHKTR